MNLNLLSEKISLNIYSMEKIMIVNISKMSNQYENSEGKLGIVSMVKEIRERTINNWINKSKILADLLLLSNIDFRFIIYSLKRYNY